MKRLTLTMILMVVFCAMGTLAAPNKGPMKDPRDGRTYKTVQIGSQTWMAENLNYKTGDSYCHDNKESSCAKYGRLYIWKAALEACPAGWHLPSKEEFELLFKAVGGTLEEAFGETYWSDVGKKLKTTRGWAENGNGGDAFGFSAQPAGYRNDSGICYDEGFGAHFWSSTGYDSSNAYSTLLYYYYGFAALDYAGKDYGHSVRCVKD